MPADIEQLLPELAHVVAVGASTAAMRRVTDDLRQLVALDCVARASSAEPLDRARRLSDVLARAVERLPDEGSLRRGIGVLVGTAKGYRLVRSTDRRTQAAQLLYDVGMSPATFLRRHQEEVLTVLAEELLRFENEFRRRATRQVMEADGPVFSALAVQWLDQFSYYYRVWTDLCGLRNDIAVYLKRKRRTPRHRTLESYCTSSLWYYARFIRSVGRFVDERGGIWMFSEQEVEQAVADTVYLVSWHAPFSEREDSWLMTALVLQEPSPTLVLFEHELATNVEGRTALEKWTEWLQSCACDLRSPLSECEVHQVMRHAARYCVLVESEWNRIAGWYRHPPSQPSTIDTIDVPALFDAFDKERWETPMDPS
jgi:hypothetical protein